MGCVDSSRTSQIEPNQTESISICSLPNRSINHIEPIFFEFDFDGKVVGQSKRGREE